MENFLLWGFSPRKASRDISFFASWVHVQRIHKGTRDMIAEMLKDAGVEDARVKSWEIGRFYTTYMSDNLDSKRWQDIWMETYELRVALDEPAHMRVQDAELVHTWASDSTWKKEEEKDEKKECVVVADFYDKEALDEADELLSAIAEGEIKSASAAKHTGKKKVPATLLSNIGKEYAQQREARNNATPKLSVGRRSGYPRQLLISLGSFPDRFFAEGAELAWLIVDLVEAIGGTTTWNERTSPEHLQ